MNKSRQIGQLEVTINIQLIQKSLTDIQSVRSVRSVRVQSMTDTEKNSQSEYDCYYRDNYQTNSKHDYECHIVLKHPRKLTYPSKVDLDKMGIEGKDKPWEI